MATRSFGLDFLRAIAILLVVFVHTFPLMPQTLLIELALLDLSGCIGVDLFFVLSGYLMGQQIFKKEAVSNLTGLITFSVKRFFRTYPLYLFFLILNFILFANKELDTLLPYLTFTHFWATNDQWKCFFYLESWTLCIEEWFYFAISLFPFLLVLFRLNYKLSVGFIVCLLCFYSIFIRWIEINYIFLDFDLIRCSTSLRYDSLCYGFLMVMLPEKINQFLARSIVAISFLFLSIFLYIYFRSPVGNFESWAFFTFPQICLAFILPRFVQINYPQNNIFYYLVTWTAKISFSLYLVNLIPIRLGWFYSTEYSYLEIVILYFIYCYILSFLSYFFIEFYFMRIRNLLIARIELAK
jgi:peptidoglycan/LPS O-acetylase OafA/YrhL